LDVFYYFSNFFLEHNNFFNVIDKMEQTLSAESFFKTLIDLSLHFFQKLCVTFSFGCFQTFWTHCIFSSDSARQVRKYQIFCVRVVNFISCLVLPKTSLFCCCKLNILFMCFKQNHSVCHKLRTRNIIPKIPCDLVQQIY
jgi:hypothetical protein